MAGSPNAKKRPDADRWYQRLALVDWVVLAIFVVPGWMLFLYGVARAALDPGQLQPLVESLPRLVSWLVAMSGLFCIGFSGYASRWPPHSNASPDRRLIRAFLQWGVLLVLVGFAGLVGVYWSTVDVARLACTLVAAAAVAFSLGWIAVSVRRLFGP